MRIAAEPQPVSTGKQVTAAFLVSTKLIVRFVRRSSRRCAESVPSNTVGAEDYVLTVF